MYLTHAGEIDQREGENASALDEIINNSHVKLLNHPCIVNLIERKW